MPRPRIYKNRAEQQRAYRQRQKKRREAESAPTVAVVDASESPAVERIQKAGEDAIEAFFRR